MYCFFCYLCRKFMNKLNFIVMKKVLLVAFMALAAMVCNAQDHLRFKGIPITGSQNAFVQQLQSKGFVYKGMQNGNIYLEGEFAKQQGVTVVVSRLANQDLVDMVIAVMPVKTNWSAIYSEYVSYKNFLIEKYGMPTSIEGFVNGEPATDQAKFQAIINCEAQFLSEYQCPNGRIQLNIVNQANNTASIMLRYIDNASTQQIRQQIIDEL